QELLARIRTILRRARRDLDANPLTHLPGNASIQSRIEDALAAGSALAVLYVDINQFKAYNDAYGYDAGDRVIRATAGLLLRLAGRGEEARDFVGHIGGDDFILLTDPRRMEVLARSIAKEFDRVAFGFHNENDRRRGKMVSTDRQGRVQEFPLLSVSIGICHNRDRRLLSYAHVAQVGAELKKHAKARPGSAYVIDRRS
ncbi:MAG: GGDEF domain-containing protein, partial [Elusimicrobiota bacterium]